MGWKLIEKVKSVVATPSLVEEFVAMMPAPGDRPFRERRVEVYRPIWKRGEFRPVTWASARCAETNNTYRVNGKHTATMLSREPAPYDPPFRVSLERYECATLDDVARLYGTFDSGVASRTAGDINASFAAATPTLHGVPHRLINLAVGAMAQAKWDETALRKVTAVERAEQLLDNADFAAWLHEMLPGGSGGGARSRVSLVGNTANSRPLSRVPVAAAMYKTYRLHPRVATEFWTLVRTDSHPDADDPTRLLSKFLNRAVAISSRGTTPRAEKKAVGSRQLYAVCVTAWNAWRKGESTQLRYFPNAALPEPVK